MKFYLHKSFFTSGKKAENFLVSEQELGEMSPDDYIEVKPSIHSHGQPVNGGRWLDEDAVDLETAATVEECYNRLKLACHRAGTDRDPNFLRLGPTIFWTPVTADLKF